MNRKREFEYFESDDEPCRKKSIICSEVNEFCNGVYTVGNQIHFNTEISKMTIEELIKQTWQIIRSNNNKKDKLVITYIINSNGGCVASAFKFLDFLDMVRETHTHVEFISIMTGMVASAGTLISLGADKKYATKSADIMIHELSTGIRGKYTQINSYNRYMRNTHKKILEVYMRFAKITKKKLEQLLNTETWCTAEEYLSYGLIDEIKVGISPRVNN